MEAERRITLHVTGAFLREEHTHAAEVAGLLVRWPGPAGVSIQDVFFK